MNKLLLSLLFLSLIAIASSHLRHKHGHRHGHGHGHGKVKKIVKIVTIGGGGKKPPASSSSSSSEEETKKTKKPPPATRATLAPPKCDKGWLEFTRKNELWCVLVGNKGANNHQLSQPEAEKICKEHKATLTGVENDMERYNIANEALHQLGEIGIEMGAVWLGATNHAACKTNSNSESCGPLNTFRWTDGYTSGTRGYKWGKDEPDNIDYPGNSVCIQQIIMSPTWIPSGDEQKWKDSFKHGDLDKYKCENPESPTTRLYACGRKAQ